MKRPLIVLVAVMAVTAFCASYVYADSSAEAITAVYVDVDPNVGVSGPEVLVRTQGVQTGEFSVDITFIVNSNQQTICIEMEATELWKGGNPLISTADPAYTPGIPLVLEAGIPLDVPGATPLNGDDTIADYLSVGASDSSIGIFPAWKTEAVCYENSTVGVWLNQAVTATVTWHQDDPNKPPGQYQALVLCRALVLP